jgi:hypothetical protein
MSIYDATLPTSRNLQVTSNVMSCHEPMSLSLTVLLLASIARSQVANAMAVLPVGPRGRPTMLHVDLDLGLFQQTD